MQRDRDEVDAGSDPPLAKRLYELPSIDRELLQVETNGVKMPCVAITRWCLVRQLHLLYIGKDGGVEACMAGSYVYKSFQLAELVDAYRGLQVTQVVLESAFMDLVIPTTLFCVSVP